MIISTHVVILKNDNITIPYNHNHLCGEVNVNIPYNNLQGKLDISSKENEEDEFF